MNSNWFIDFVALIKDSSFLVLEQRGVSLCLFLIFKASLTLFFESEVAVPPAI